MNSDVFFGSGRAASRRGLVACVVVLAAILSAGCGALFGADFEDTSRKASGDAGQEAAADAETLATDAACPGEAPTDFPAKPAKPADPTACSDADFANGSKLIAAKASLEEIYNGLSPNCVTCVFSRESDNNWGNYVVLADGSAFLNESRCYSLNKSPACGAAIQRAGWCSEMVCKGCDAFTRDTSCYDNSLDGPCKDELAKVQEKCSGSAPAACTKSDTIAFVGCH